MVTYIDSKNASKYHILFDKAAELLKEKKPQDMTGTLEQYQMSWDTFSISTLNEYFAYLKELKDLAETDDDKKFFLRLPLDEDLFEINANTREVTVPESLASVGVQGDELAEIVYFSIDRFFDFTDLANENINIVIQWEATDLNGETIQGFSRNFGKDIETIPGKIIFGWAISHEFTGAPGNIRFAVRFYSYNENNEFTYSLATLPATIRIQASLDHDVINKTIPEIDYGNLLLSRVTNSGIYDKSLPTPSEPDIVKELYVLSPAGYENQKIVDLPDDDNGIVLAIGAQPTDIGVVGVDWRYFSYGSGDYSKDSISFNASSDEKMLLVTETLNSEKTYYTTEDEVQYSKFTDFDSLESLELQTQVIEHEEPEEDEIITGYKLTDNNSLIQLYEKVYTVTIKETEEFKATGVYTADVYSRALVNTKTKHMSRSDGITIPGPLNPVIDVKDDEYFDNTAIITDEDTLDVHIATDDDSFVLKVIAEKGEDLKEASEVGENPRVDLTYQWQKENQSHEWIDLVRSENSTDPENGLTISNLNLLSTLDDKYRAVVTSHRNGQTTSINSGIYRVTPTPKEPDISVQFNKLTYSGVQTVWEKHKYNKNLPGENKMTMSLSNALNIRVDRNIQTDKLSYVWMYYQTEGPIDLTDDEVVNTALQPLEERLGEIFNDPRDDMDSIIVDLTEFNNNDLVVLEDETSAYTSSITPDKTGFYYCVVINELNGHINAAATPIFQVTTM